MMNTSGRLHFRRLHSTEELQRFALEYYESKQKQNVNAGHEDTSQISLAYLHSSEVYGLFDSNDQMLAGYVIGTEWPLRLLDLLLPETRSVVIAQHKTILDNCCEITSAWRSPAVSSVFMSAYFWPHVIFNVFKTGKPFFLGASANKGLDKFYTQAGTRTLYAGSAIEGLTARLFYYNRFGLLCYMFHILAIETPRRFFRQLFKRRKKMKAI